ncbi:MAG: helix-hairpin-helix domain-containing protein [Myxococcales bacterium]|nr:helix-hairpin-helix domain-containing protein [Myxococcales bacterium]
MTPLATMDVIGYWIAIFLTICILSYLYKDNPFYKFAEHLFIGVSLGYVIVQQYHDGLKEKLVVPLMHQFGFGEGEKGAGLMSMWDKLLAGQNYEPWFSSGWWKLVPLLLIALMFTKALSRKHSWIGRYPLALVVGLYAGLQINALVQSDLGKQLGQASRPLYVEKMNLNTASAEALGALPGMTPVTAAKLVDERKVTPFKDVGDAMTRASLSADEREVLSVKRGQLVGLDAKAGVADRQVNWFGVFSNVLLLLGTLATLLYFYYSFAHKGLIGGYSRFGVWILMIGFGASFGFTVQGRIALAIGRAKTVMGESFAMPQDAAQVNSPIVAIISILIIVAGIAFWERRQAKA